jgi:hypothetical protein
MFYSMSVDDGELISPLNDLFHRLWIVDSVERLGIDRHFKSEIKSALDYVYRFVHLLGIYVLYIYAMIMGRFNRGLVFNKFFMDRIKYGWNILSSHTK